MVRLSMNMKYPIFGHSPPNKNKSQTIKRISPKETSTEITVHFVRLISLSRRATIESQDEMNRESETKQQQQQQAKI